MVGRRVKARTTYRKRRVPDPADAFLAKRMQATKSKNMAAPVDLGITHWTTPTSSRPKRERMRRKLVEKFGPTPIKQCCLGQLFDDNDLEVQIITARIEFRDRYFLPALTPLIPSPISPDEWIIPPTPSPVYFLKQTPFLASVSTPTPSPASGTVPPTPTPRFVLTPTLSFASVTTVLLLSPVSVTTSTSSPALVSIPSPVPTPLPRRSKRKKVVAR